MSTPYGDAVIGRVEKLCSTLDEPKFNRLCKRFPESNDYDFGQPGEVTMARMVYLTERLRGVEHVWAAMTATRKGPGLNTDVLLFHGQRCLRDQFGTDAEFEGVLAAAKKSGYTPGQHDKYEKSLANYPGDPAAFIPPSGGRSHIMAVLEERNLSCDGFINRKATERSRPEIPTTPQLADDLAFQAAWADGAITEKSKNHLPDVLDDYRKKHGLSSKNLCGFEGNANDAKPAKVAFTSKSIPKKKAKGK